MKKYEPLGKCRKSLPTSHQSVALFCWQIGEIIKNELPPCSQRVQWLIGLVSSALFNLGAFHFEWAPFRAEIHEEVVHSSEQVVLIQAVVYVQAFLFTLDQSRILQHTQVLGYGWFTHLKPVHLVWGPVFEEWEVNVAISMVPYCRNYDTRLR